MTVNFAAAHINLAQPRLGAQVVYATDDFFADKSRLIAPAEPVFIPDKYDDNGKWMDGWESRRKRGPGHDHAIVRLGRAGIIHGVDIDTRHFTGNYPPAAALEVCNSPDHVPADSTDWTTLVAQMPLKGDSRHLVEVNEGRAWTHVRLNIFPDGGVARLRLYGRIAASFAPGEHIDLAALENGGRPLACNDAHFGMPENMIAPGRGLNMGDGWETRRRREPGHDWAVLALAATGTVGEILIDTAYFKGNYPDRAFIQAALVPANMSDDAIVAHSAGWPLLLPESKLSADAEHHFAKELKALGPVSHVRLNIVPDGGISRLRLFGAVA